MSNNKTHKCIKGMDSKMQCKGFQYKEGETYKIPENVIKCELSAGLHTRAGILQSLLDDFKNYFSL